MRELRKEEGGWEGANAHLQEDADARKKVRVCREAGPLAVGVWLATLAARPLDMLVANRGIRGGARRGAQVL